MIKIVIITHGQLGTELLKTAESIVGVQENVSVLTLADYEGLTALVTRTKEVLEDGGIEQGVLIFTDMLGGTPCNACLPFCNTPNVEIVSGVNLYMLLSAFINRKKTDLKELSDKAISDGKKNIANVKDMFLKKLR